jgi:hypothetical protein
MGIIILRMLFALAAFFVYISGVYLLNIFNYDNNAYYNVLPGVLVTIFLYIFLDPYLKLADKRRFKLKKDKWTMSHEGINIEMTAQYDGNNNISFALKELSGLKGLIPFLNVSGSNYENKSYDIPEQFETILSSTNPIIKMKIKLIPKNDFVPLIIIPLLGIKIIIVNLLYLLNKKNKSKRLVLYWR